MTWKLSIVVAVLLAACSSGGRRHDPETPVEPRARPDAAVQVVVDAAPEVVGVALVVTPATAQVSIDDVDHGVASKLATVVPLEPGLHYVVVTQQGYKAFRLEFAVTDKTERLTVRLERSR